MDRNRASAWRTMMLTRPVERGGGGKEEGERNRASAVILNRHTGTQALLQSSGSPANSLPPALPRFSGSLFPPSRAAMPLPSPCSCSTLPLSTPTYSTALTGPGYCMQRALSCHKRAADI